MQMGVTQHIPMMQLEDYLTSMIPSQGRLSIFTDINTLINGVAAGFSLRYDALGRRTGITLPNGVTTNYAYDNSSRLLNLEHLNPVNQVLESLTYTVDATGNRTSMNRQSVNLPLPNPAFNIN